MLTIVYLRLHDGTTGPAILQLVAALGTEAGSIPWITALRTETRTARDTTGTGARRRVDGRVTRHVGGPTWRRRLTVHFGAWTRSRRPCASMVKDMRESL